MIESPVEGIADVLGYFNVRNQKIPYPVKENVLLNDYAELSLKWEDPFLKVKTLRIIPKPTTITENNEEQNISGWDSQIVNEITENNNYYQNETVPKIESNLTENNEESIPTIRKLSKGSINTIPESIQRSSSTPPVLNNTSTNNLENNNNNRTLSYSTSDNDIIKNVNNSKTSHKCPAYELLEELYPNCPSYITEIVDNYGVENLEDFSLLENTEWEEIGVKPVHQRKIKLEVEKRLGNKNKTKNNETTTTLFETIPEYYNFLTIPNLDELQYQTPPMTSKLNGYSKEKNFY